jgi:hypothetical protein
MDRPRYTLEPLGPHFVTTREELHRVAEELVAPARKPHNEIALKATPPGFGTPVFPFEGKDWQVRVEGATLRVIEGDDDRALQPLTSLAAGAELIGEAMFPDGAPTDTDPLEIDEGDAFRIGAWFELADSVLEELRAQWSGAGPSEANLWPEHFDLAIEAGDEAAGHRANYGFSPGDVDHDEPYLYVGPWDAEVTGDIWNAQGFTGAEISYSELAATDDPRATALGFCRVRESALSS